MHFSIHFSLSISLRKMLTSPKTGVGCGFEKLILREVNAFDNLQESRVGINKTRNMSPSFQTAYLL